MHLVLSRVSWWVQLSKGVGFHWNFMPIIPRPNRNDFSQINRKNKLFFFFFPTSLIVPIKNYTGMQISLYQSLPLYKEHIWLERVSISNFTAPTPQTTRIRHSVPFMFSQVLRLTSVFLSFYWKHLWWDYSGLHLFGFVFTDNISLWAYETSWGQQIHSGLFLPHSCFQLMNFQHIIGILINS